jgi:hypothetical protein
MVSFEQSASWCFISRREGSYESKRSHIPQGHFGLMLGGITIRRQDPKGSLLLIKWYE